MLLWYIPLGLNQLAMCNHKSSADQLWLNTYPLDRNLVFDYFALSPFYDWTCNNEQLRMRSIHPLDLSQLTNLEIGNVGFYDHLAKSFAATDAIMPVTSVNYLSFFHNLIVCQLGKMTGIEFSLSEVMEPHLFVFRKQKRDSPEKVTPMLTYYVLDGSIYQAPQLCNVFAARLHIGLHQSFTSFQKALGASRGRALFHISKAFTFAATKLEKIGYVDAENESGHAESKAPKETIDFKELKRVDHILASLQRKLPPAPPPPPFPDGYTRPSTAEASENQPAEAQPPPVDPIIDQGPSKRMRV
nr:mediator of RNA polymerase II transcription subunit 6 [Ipomoea batatas]